MDPTDIAILETTIMKNLKKSSPICLDEGDDGGYDVDLVDRDDLPHDLKCAVCWKLMREPVQLGCGHGYCSSCLANLKKQSSRGGKISCPTCRVPLNPKKVFENKMLKRYITSLRAKCKNSHLGCKWEGEVGTIKSHYCNYESSTCNRCNERMERHLLLDHVRTCYESAENELKSTIERHETTIARQETTIAMLKEERDRCQTNSELLAATNKMLTSKISSLERKQAVATMKQQQQDPAYDLDDLVNLYSFGDNNNNNSSISNNNNNNKVHRPSPAALTSSPVVPPPTHFEFETTSTTTTSRTLGSRKTKFFGSSADNTISSSNGCGGGGMDNGDYGNSANLDSKRSRMQQFWNHSSNTISTTPPSVSSSSASNSFVGAADSFFDDSTITTNYDTAAAAHSNLFPCDDVSTIFKKSSSASSFLPTLNSLGGYSL